MIEPRTRELMQDLKKVDGFTIRTNPHPTRSLAIESFQPGNLDIRKLSTTLYQKDQIGCATRGGKDQPDMRLSPHFCNTHDEVAAQSLR